MPLVRSALEVPQEIAAGAPFELDEYLGQPDVGWLILRDEPGAPAMNATYHVEVSATYPREDLWEQVGANVIASMASPIAIPAGFKWIRIRASAYTAGAPYCYFTGPVWE